MDLKDTIALRIKTMRRNRNLTQDDLAELIERSVYTVSKIERGETVPNIYTLARLAHALEVPVGVFFEEPASDPKRDALMARLTDAAHGLDQRTLALAVTQIEALAGLKS